MPIPYRFRIVSLTVLDELVQDALVDGKYHWGKLLVSKTAVDILGPGLADGSVDSVHFFAGGKVHTDDTEVDPDYQGTRGLAKAQQMCSERSVAMTKVDNAGGDTTAATFAHEMGHVLGMNHDSAEEWNGPGCTGTPVQMMGGSGTMDIASWSPCSVQQAERWFGCWGCLHRDPKAQCVDEERGCAHYGTEPCKVNSGNTRKNTLPDGTPCQAWSEQSPQTHSYSSQAQYGRGNECRVTSSSNEAAWCYSTDPSKTWEYCWPPCEAKAPSITSCVKADGSCAMYAHKLCKSNDGLPDKNVTRTGRVCQAWGEQTPHAHSYSGNAEFGNNCRADGKSSAPWCYTTDPDKKWDYCWWDCVGVIY